MRGSGVGSGLGSGLGSGPSSGLGSGLGSVAVCVLGSMASRPQPVAG